MRESLTGERERERESERDSLKRRKSLKREREGSMEFKRDQAIPRERESRKGHHEKEHVRGVVREERLLLLPPAALGAVSAVFSHSSLDA